MQKITKILHNTIVNFFDKSIPYSQKTYSQEGEDIILANLLNGKKNGFYVDIGAHHPFRFSNTYFFYNLGWRGINIDATPGSMSLFNKYRPRDINIETAIGNSSNKTNYYIFNEPALNSFSSTLSNQRHKIASYKLEKTIKLSTQKLSQVLDKNLPTNTKIDFMSIDVEGHEHKVITSNNWHKYQPTYLLIEILITSLKDLKKNKTHQLITKNKYSIIAITGRTIIYKKS